MIIKTIFLSLFLISTIGFAQDLEQTLNDASVVTSVMNTHKRENKRLVKIENNQAKIIVPTMITARKAVKLSLRQQRLYNSLYKIFDVVDNLQLFLKILNESDEIADALKELYELSKDHPEATTLAAYSELFVLKKSVGVLGNLFRATQQSKFNLMNNVQRIELMGRCLDDLISLKTYIYYIKTLVIASINTELYTDIVHNGEEQEGIDFSDLLTNLESDFEEIFPETLDEE